MRPVRVHLFVNDGVEEIFVSCVVDEQGEVTFHQCSTQTVDRDGLTDVMRTLVTRIVPVDTTAA